VIEGSRPIAEVARELGIDEGTLGNWVNQYRPDDGLAPARSAHRADRAPWMAGMTTFAGIMLIIALDLFVIWALTALNLDPQMNCVEGAACERGKCFLSWENGCCDAPINAA
jgi:hypothetical protein